MSSFNPLGSVLEKALSLFSWLTGKIDDKQRDDDRHVLTRYDEANDEAKKTGDTSGVEKILGE